MPREKFSADPGLERLRRVRAELRQSMGALEHALAAPAPGRATAWAERVHVALVELLGDLREHVAITEGPGGLYVDIRTAAPRLSPAVARLGSEHPELTGQVEELLARLDAGAVDGDVAELRGLGTALLGGLARHRQRGADLVYEAFEADIGGET